jgi:hypothetical protein
MTSEPESWIVGRRQFAGKPGLMALVLSGNDDVYRERHHVVRKYSARKGRQTAVDRFAEFTLNRCEWAREDSDEKAFS